MAETIFDAVAGSNSEAIARSRNWELIATVTSPQVYVNVNLSSYNEVLLIMYGDSNFGTATWANTFPVSAFPSSGYCGIYDASHSAWARIVDKSSARIGSADYPMRVYAR